MGHTYLWIAERSGSSRDVFGKFLYLKSKKKSSHQSFPIPTQYHDAVKAVKQFYQKKGIEVTKNTLLFLSNKSHRIKAMSRPHISKRFTTLCKELDGIVNMHSLRKTFLTRIYEKTGYNLIETQKYSRHKNLSNLQAYIKTTETTDLVLELAW
jgi:integrase